jgi:hypothetical protein
VFDIFGRYLKTLPLPGLGGFQVMADQLVYVREGRLWSFHLTALLERPFVLPMELPQGCKLEVGNGVLFLLAEGKLSVQRI